MCYTDLNHSLGGEEKRFYQRKKAKSSDAGCLQLSKMYCPVVYMQQLDENEIVSVF